MISVESTDKNTPQNKNQDREQPSNTTLSTQEVFVK